MISIFAIIILALAFLSLIALMIIHEFGHFIIAKKFGVRVEEFGVGYPPRIFGKKFGDTIYSINWIPLGAFVRIYGEEGGVDDYRSFAGLKIWQRVLIVIGGVAAFWIASIVIFSVLFAMGSDLPISDDQVMGVTNPRLTIIEVQANSAADEAGLKKGDVVTAINAGGIETPIDTVTKFREVTSQNKGNEIGLEVLRNGKSQEVLLTPKADVAEGEGPVGVGIQRMATLIEKYPWYQAPVQGVIYTWQVTVGTIVGLWAIFSQLFAGQGMPEGAQFAGPLGITVFLANAASYGVGFFLYFIGSLSVAVAVFNLFPIPALDGGKLIFLIIEKIKGKPISVQVEQGVTVFFFFLLIVMSIYITVRFDIPRFSNYFTSAIDQNK
jgi:regulator of sigma E protease